MAERRSIVELWRGRSGEPAILATLVRVEGSSYRRPGAHLYICPGTYVGSISGGCLEGEIVRKAPWLTRAGAALQTYSTLFDDTHEIPYGLGCGGVLDLLLEPALAPEGTALLHALVAAQRGEVRYSATILPSAKNPAHGMARALTDSSGSILFASPGLDPSAQAALAALALGAAQAECVPLQIAGEARVVFVEPILPPQRLVIFGAGDDARPLARMAHSLGWRVAVADGRATLAQSERFPEAEQVLRLRDGAANLEELRLTRDDVAAVMTHSYDQDRALLPRLLPLQLRYLGLLGARHRSHLLLNETAKELGWTPEQCVARVHAPIGLNLGGDTPEAVALTILAEIQAELHGKPVISRKMTAETLRSAPERPYVPSICPLDADDTTQLAR